MPRQFPHLTINQRRRLAVRRHLVRARNALRQSYAIIPKNPVIIPCVGRFTGEFIQPLQSISGAWNNYHYNHEIFNHYQSLLVYPLKVWENLMVAITTQELWLEKWARLIADAQYQLIQNTELKLFMEALLGNGLLLINPPARIHHTTPQYADFREHIVDQLMTRRQLGTHQVTDILRWNRNNGVSIVGSMELQATKIAAIAYLRLEAGALEYNIYCDPFTNWERVRPQINHQEIEYDSDESLGQNFLYCSSYPIMNPISILAWNVRGAGNAEFRRAFFDLIARYKPNVVLLTETRVGGDRATAIINSLGFHRHYKVDPMGYAGGLWLLWNDEQINMHIEGHTFQEIHAVAEVSATIRVLLSFVYGSPDRNRRKILWSNLVSVASLTDMPWLVCGDFNDILSPSEKWGRRDACRTRMGEFQNCINSCGLSDLGFTGPKFTWINKRSEGGLVLERLDRFLGNGGWISLFPDSTNYHLPRLKSDHNPILLRTHPHFSSFGPRPFRCESIWLHQPDFISLSRSIWENSSSSSDALNFLKKKNRVLRRLEGAQRALALSPNSFLVKLEKELNSEFLNLLLMEEQLWALKSRDNWLSLGDANIAFFHASVINRRRKNRINSIKDTMGNWLHDAEDIKNCIKNHFSNLLSPSPAIIVQSLPQNSFSFIGVANSLFTTIPTILEIKEALWDLKPNKAPGIDGFSHDYFQKCWDSVHQVVCADIQACFLNESIPMAWNQTLICLIPKVSQPTEANHLRPISLCSTLYKVVTIGEEAKEHYS